MPEWPGFADDVEAIKQRLRTELPHKRMQLPNRQSTCEYCLKSIYQDSYGNWIDDETDGDVCGWQGGNEPHLPGIDPDVYLAPEPD